MTKHFNQTKEEPKRKVKAFQQVLVIYEKMKERKRVLQSEKVAEFWRKHKERR